jgi:hypothetical protein
MVVSSYDVWNNTAQIEAYLNALNIGRCSNQNELLDQLPTVTIGDDIRKQESVVRQALEDLSRVAGRRFSYVDNSAANIAGLVHATSDPFLNDTLERLIEQKLVELKLYPSREDFKAALRDSSKPIALEPYVELSEKIFKEASLKNLDILRFIAGVAKETKIHQFIIPDFSTKINQVGSSGNLLVHGGYKVLKFTDETLDKFELYSLLDSRTQLRDNLECYMNHSRGGIEVKFNGETSYRVVGQFPGRSQLKSGYTDEEIQEVYTTLLSLVGDDPEKIFGIQPSNKQYRSLGVGELVNATPTEILSIFVDTDLPVDLQHNIYNAKWIWDPSYKDGPRLILNGSGMDDVDSLRIVKDAVEGCLSKHGISVVNYDYDDSSHLEAEARGLRRFSNGLKVVKDF